MTSKIVKWGVLSTANIGRARVNPAIQASRNGELVGVASRDKERAREFANHHNIETAYGSYQELLEDERIEAVYIPLPNSLHHEWTIRAAGAGKHILCEKPLALNARQCLEMQQAAQTHGVKLMEAFMYRFHPRTRRVIEMVRQGAIGEARILRSSFTFCVTKPDNIRLNQALGGGALMDVGCYCVNISRTLAGSEPLQVQAFSRVGSSGVDLELVGTLRFPSGLIAQFDCALTVERREEYEIAGPEASLRVPQAFLPGTSETQILETRGRQGDKQHEFPGVDEYQLMVEHFGDCILENREPLCSAVEAARNLRVIEALFASAARGGMPIPFDSAGADPKGETSA